MVNLNTLPRDIWAALVDFLPSPELVCLYCTGSALLCQSLVATVKRMEVGVVSKRKVSLWPNLTSLSIRRGIGPLIESFDLSSWTGLRSLTLQYRLDSTGIQLHELPNLTYLNAEVPQLDKFLASTTAPLTTLILKTSNRNSSVDLSKLPATLTMLQLAQTKKRTPMKLPLPASIRTLQIDFDHLNHDLPLLGLPENLTDLAIRPAAFNAASNRSTDWIAQLPRGLLYLRDLTKRKYANAFPFATLPPRLRTLDIDTVTRDSVQLLPRSLLTLHMGSGGGFAIAEQIHDLPHNLTVLNLPRDLYMTEAALSSLPKTLTCLEMTNGALTGRAIEKLPPHLTILRMPPNMVLTHDQAWVPFCFDPQYMPKLPLSLTRLEMHVLTQGLPGALLARFPPSLTSIAPSFFSISPTFDAELDQHDLIRTCLLDLREVTSMEELKDVIRLFREELTQADPRDTAFQRQLLPSRLIIYTAFPRTIEFSQSIITGEKITDLPGFITLLQSVYEAAATGPKLHYSPFESHVVLLPTADITKIPNVRIIAAPYPNKRIRVFYPDAEQLVLQSVRRVRSSHVSRLSLDSFPRYDDVAVGGTFDHMHTGHRLLLSACLLTARKRLVIGVTGEPLLAKKKYREYLQPLSVRTEGVHQFCRLQRPDLRLDISELLEVAGPTAREPNFDLLVVSEETRGGIEIINTARAEKGFNPMEGLVVPLASDDEHTTVNGVDEHKLSSTTLRLLESQLLDNLYANNPRAVRPSQPAS